MNQSIQSVVPAASIVLGENVRKLDKEHVRSLTESIEARGLLVPMIVRPTDAGKYLLLAGYHRYAACQGAGLEKVPVVIRDSGDAADSAIENITRRDLTYLEEAGALNAILDDGLDENKAAAALGWSPARVKARAGIFELSKAGQWLADGNAPAAAVNNLVAIAQESAPLAAQVAAYLKEQVETGVNRGVSQLASEPGRLVHEVLTRSEPKRGRYVALFTRLEQWRMRPGVLGLGDALDQQLTDLHELFEKYNSYGRVEITDQDIDRARAAGVLVDIGGTLVITDKAMHRDILQDAATRTTEALHAAIAERRAARTSAAGEQPSELEVVEREHRAVLRDFGHRAANVNLDLGGALMANAIEAGPDDMNVARFFVYGLLGPAGADTARNLATAGMRLILEEHRTTEQRTRKDGTPRTPKVTYTGKDEVEAAMWKFLARAKTPRELYGRALVIYAAGHYALQEALPGSKRSADPTPRSESDAATKALEKLIGRHLPGTYRQLVREMRKEADDYREQTLKLRSGDA